MMASSSPISTNISGTVALEGGAARVRSVISSLCLTFPPKSAMQNLYPEGIVVKLDVNVETSGNSSQRGTAMCFSRNLEAGPALLNDTIAPLPFSVGRAVASPALLGQCDSAISRFELSACAPNTSFAAQASTSNAPWISSQDY